jgi:hypothetical protein
LRSRASSSLTTSANSSPLSRQVSRTCMYISILPRNTKIWIAQPHYSRVTSHHPELLDVKRKHCSNARSSAHGACTSAFESSRGFESSVGLKTCLLSSRESGNIFICCRMCIPVPGPVPENGLYSGEMIFYQDSRLRFLIGHTEIQHHGLQIEAPATPCIASPHELDAFFTLAAIVYSTALAVWPSFR